MSTRRRITRRYAATLFGITLGVLALILAVNLVVDPLWFLSGNRLGVNYPFNERISKTNLLLDDSEAYDCVVLGSSRTTLLDAGRIEGHRCFNYAVSQATDRDLKAQLRYLAHHMPQISLIVVGVDSYLLTPNVTELANGVPPFMQSLSPPPDMLSTYLSLDALDFSWRTLQREPPNFRFYDEHFVVGVVPGAGPYEPPTEIDVAGPKRYRGSFDQFPPGPFSSDRATLYDAVADAFPAARRVGYVPPVSAHYVARLRFAETLESYFTANLAAARRFDAYYDFSVPSEMTTNPANTFDGGHYYPEANHRVTDVLNGAAPNGLALAVHTLTPAAYRDTHRARVDAYIAREGLRPAARSTAALR